MSTIVIGSFDCGWGLPVFIRMLLLALKYMEGSLFQFPFCFGDLLKAASIAAASLAKISGDFSLCYSVSRLPVEVVFWLPVETVFTVSVCLARGVFPFNFCVVALVVPSFVWNFAVLSALFYNRFFLGCLCHCSSTVLGFNNLAFAPFPLYSCLA